MDLHHRWRCRQEVPAIAKFFNDRITRQRSLELLVTWLRIARDDTFPCRPANTVQNRRDLQIDKRTIKKPHDAQIRRRAAQSLLAGTRDYTQRNRRDRPKYFA